MVDADPKPAPAPGALIRGRTAPNVVIGIALVAGVATVIWVYPRDSEASPSEKLTHAPREGLGESVQSTASHDYYLHLNICSSWAQLIEQRLAEARSNVQRFSTTLALYAAFCAALTLLAGAFTDAASRQRVRVVLVSATFVSTMLVGLKTWIADDGQIAGLTTVAGALAMAETGGAIRDLPEDAWERDQVYRTYASFFEDNCLSYRGNSNLLDYRSELRASEAAVRTAMDREVNSRHWRDLVGERLATDANALRNAYLDSSWSCQSPPIGRGQTFTTAQPIEPYDCRAIILTWYSTSTRGHAWGTVEGVPGLAVDADVSLHRSFDSVDPVEAGARRTGAPIDPVVSTEYASFFRWCNDASMVQYLRIGFRTSEPRLQAQSASEGSDPGVTRVHALSCSRAFEPGESAASQ